MSDPFCRLYSTETRRNIVAKPYASGRRQDHIDVPGSAKLPPVVEERSLRDSGEEARQRALLSRRGADVGSRSGFIAVKEIEPDKVRRLMASSKRQVPSLGHQIVFAGLKPGQTRIKQPSASEV